MVCVTKLLFLVPDRWSTLTEAARVALALAAGTGIDPKGAQAQRANAIL